MKHSLKAGHCKLHLAKNLSQSLKIWPLQAASCEQLRHSLKSWPLQAATCEEPVYNEAQLAMSGELEKNLG